MSATLPGQSLDLAPTLRPIVQSVGAGSVTAGLDWLSRAGFRAVQLDATLPGIRPRELDTRARRDLLSGLGRRGLVLGGVDLLIPRKHFAEPDHQDRAVAAALDAIAFCRDVGRPALSLGLALKTLDPTVRDTLLGAGDAAGVRFCIHAEDQPELLDGLIDSAGPGAVGFALDPVTLMALGQDPVAQIHKRARRLGAARLCDAVMQGESGNDVDTGSGSVGQGLRVPVGEGELDVVMYRLALELATARTGPVILDLRGLPTPGESAMTAARVWEGAGLGR